MLTPQQFNENACQGTLHFTFFTTPVKNLRNMKRARILFTVRNVIEDVFEGMVGIEQSRSWKARDQGLLMEYAPHR